MDNNITPTFEQGEQDRFSDLGMWTVVTTMKIMEGITFNTRYGPSKMPDYFLYPTISLLYQYDMWCKEQIPKDEHYRKNFRYYFKNSEDALAFKITFGY